ncbi:MAG: hypothetical protein JSS39_17625 [Nitrospira sp.]|nr:hypothetical protein [Nitrospira sp.]
MTCQQHQAGCPLDQRADGGSAASAFEQVAFPVARHRSGSTLDGPLGDRRHVGNLAAAVCSSCPRPTDLACLTQRRQQLCSAELRVVHIQADIDGLAARWLLMSSGYSRRSRPAIYSGEQPCGSCV